MGDPQELPDLFVGVNTPENPDDPTDLENKHIPVITAPDSVEAGECFEVTIEVGKLKEHPNEIKHYIEFIQLYAGDTYLARLDLTAVRTCPVMKAAVRLDRDLGPLRAFERCNLHGVWEAQKSIAVKS